MRRGKVFLLGMRDSGGGVTLRGESSSLIHLMDRCPSNSESRSREGRISFVRYYRLN